MCASGEEVAAQTFQPPKPRQCCDTINPVAVAGRQSVLDPSAAFAHMRAPAREQGDRADHMQDTVGVAARNPPTERRAYVRQLDLEPVEPGGLLRVIHMERGLVGQARERVEVAGLD